MDIEPINSRPWLWIISGVTFVLVSGIFTFRMFSNQNTSVSADTKIAAPSAIPIPKTSASPTATKSSTSEISKIINEVEISQKDSRSLQLELNKIPSDKDTLPAL